MVSVLAPLAYVAFLVGSLAIFSRVYRRRQAAKGIREPWFPQHTTRDIYVSLLSMDPPPAKPVLVAALIRRAMTDVTRIMEIRQSKMALQTLLQKGQIGDDTWNHLLETEKELEAELLEVVGEANTFRPGWGQIIFAHASDMVQHEKHQKIFASIEGEREKARALYGGQPKAYAPPPIVGIAASNPKKRSLPANLQNAQIPPSKPATPLPPPTSASTAGTPSKQTVPGSTLSPAAAAAGAVKANGTPSRAPVTPSKAGAATPPRLSSTPSAAASKSNSPLNAKTPSTSNSPAKGAEAPSMQRANTAQSSASEANDAENGSGDDDEEEEGAGSGPGGVLSNATNTPSGNGKKTPKKTPNKKKKKGKK